MNNIVINIETESNIRASETMADLRNVVENMYFPLRVAGFWDSQANVHLCPQEERRQECPHKSEDGEVSKPAYVETLQKERKVSTEVYFPHADLTFYLS
jgi:hypothetical protein